MDASPPATPVRRQTWAESYAALQSYVDEHRAIPTLNYVAPDGYCLGTWVSSQRVEYRHGKLRAELIEQLEQVPGWTWNALDEAWLTRYAELKRFTRRFGKLPTTFKTDDVTLARWARAQAAAHKQGKLAPERAARLEKLRAWTWNFEEAEWQTLYGELQRHMDEGNPPPVPRCLSRKGFRIGSWTSIQRKHYLSGRIDPDLAGQLEQLVGWPWATTNYDATAEVPWDTSYLALQDYIAEHGAPPPHDYATESGCWLGPWVAAQRASHAANTLRDDRVRRLEQIIGWTWQAPTDSGHQRVGWDSRFNDLARYVEQHGAMPLTGSHTPRGAWMTQQRIAHSKGQLAPERVAQLEALPGWTWDPRESAWDSAYATLLQYVKENRTLPSLSYVTNNGLRLGQWIKVQRVSFNRGKLSPERIARLERVDGWVWAGSDRRFDEACAAFTEYFRRHQVGPTADYVTDQGIRLGAWVSRQRSNYRHGRLDPDRLQRLQELGVLA